MHLVQLKRVALHMHIAKHKRTLTDTKMAFSIIDDTVKLYKKLKYIKETYPDNEDKFPIIDSYYTKIYSNFEVMTDNEIDEYSKIVTQL